MLMIVSVIVLLEIVLIIKHRHDTMAIVILFTGGATAIALCYWCGRNYVERILGWYKVQLKSCLQELQNS